ncbi:MAG TPA: histidine phosphatase family protein, partial [Lapillicoccus sp.]
MSDLQCPARFLVARHGEAMYAHPELLSDEGGRLTDLGKEQAADLAERLRGERVAAVYTSRL